MTDKITLGSIASFQNDSTAAIQYNANNASITTALNNTLSRDGTSPNQMGSNLDMNSNQILNLPSPAGVNSPARLIDVTANPTITVPPVGTSGATVPLLNGNNTWSGTNSFSGSTVAALTVTGSLTATGLVTNADLTNSSLTVAGTAIALGASGGLTSLTNSLGADVLLNNTANFFDGPSVAQGAVGTWFASGTVTVFGVAGDGVVAKLYDGTTVIAAGVANIPSGGYTSISLSGILTTPAGNIRIAVKDANSTTAKIIFNQSTLSKDSTVTAIRIA